jgi:hypothetical protein
VKEITSQPILWSHYNYTRRNEKTEFFQEMLKQWIQFRKLNEAVQYQRKGYELVKYNHMKARSCYEQRISKFG